MDPWQRALEEVAAIRRQLAAARFRAVSPRLNLAFAAASLLLALWQVRHGVAEGRTFARQWGALMLAASTSVAALALGLASRLHGAVAGALLGRAARDLAPFAAAGTALSAALWRLPDPGPWLLPGLWLLLVGLFGFAVRDRVPPPAVAVAFWYLLWGVLLALAGSGGALSPWLVAMPLAIGQLATAAVFRQAQADG
ncbi:MAG: hypothetical protein KatS3mg124_0673 [Porticoccaceae bacterium]|nr:MAG: hypothetical protein KatS3mg124_0673 [Porticoccaceae bacterium]